MSFEHADATSQGTLPATSRRFVLTAALAAAGLGGVLALLAGRGSARGGGVPEGDFILPAVEGLRGPDGGPLPGITRRTLTGVVTVMNVWASWCPYCRGEHGTLMAYSRDSRVNFVGVVYRDTPEAVRAYLLGAGVPYRALGHDPQGIMSRALGIRGVPTTVVLDRRGAAVRKLAGGLDAERIRRELLPAIDEAILRG
ncbi:TlpA family protein disulfide reductase [Alsobacter sp. R-9]